MESTATPAIRTLEEIRKDFPLLEREMNGQPLAFLDSAASSQKPNAVIQKIARYYEQEHANVHRGVYQISQEATTAFEEARELARELINAPSAEEVIFVRGTTEGINLVASSYSRKFIQQGDAVLITAMEHHSNIVPWQMACEAQGAELRVAPINDAGELLLEELYAMLDDKVKMVALTHVSNSMGTINPVKSIISRAHTLGIPVLVDGAQAIPHMKVDVQELDADFYTFSGHKMFGPTGVGILYGKREWLDAMPPYHGGGEMIKTVTFEKTTYNELPHKFEAGTPDIAGVIGLGEAIRYMNSIGHGRIQEHEHNLLAYATEALSQIEGLRIIGTAQDKASVVSFIVDGVHPYDLGALLDKQGIAVRTGHHCTQPLMDRFGIPGTVRASLAFYNNQTDIDRLVAGVKRALNMLR
ncbi:aminotransferase class V-fold PLP-dependent enzyme [Phaeodactylibacter luteus]|uniref:Probable cysteine desulfurase n=1 Tax=Phaeodactylibacter luteus TaxID=1564516 RepID=A0A5C6S606_9BACT|nr:cysteine desulfurase [Phaeodactylibacter luteus]TXB69431.1 cysteine desulfurase [Phaeodactylibacter luteus]